MKFKCKSMRHGEYGTGDATYVCNGVPRCSGCAEYYTISARMRGAHNAANDYKPLLPEMRDEIARMHPDLVMDEPGDSVPDVQVRAEDPSKPACKWHGKKIEHGVPPPDMCSDETFRSDVQGSPALSIGAMRIYAVERNLCDQYMERVVSWIRNNFREMPSCCGIPVSVETKDDGHKYWFCEEHYDEEG